MGSCCTLVDVAVMLMCWSLLLDAQVVQATEQLFASGQLQKPVAKMYEEQACDNRWRTAHPSISYLHLLAWCGCNCLPHTMLMAQCLLLYAMQCWRWRRDGGASEGW